MNTKFLNAYMLSGVLALGFITMNAGLAIAAASSTPSTVASTTVSTSTVATSTLATTTTATSTMIGSSTPAVASSTIIMSYFINSSSPIVTASSTASSTIAVGSCPLITSPMQAGINNNSNQVIKLQTFLKNNEKFDVDITGVYDDKTVTAVKAFQTANINDTMGPWHSKTPSGNVGITTSKEINKIACNIPLTLNTKELGTIEAYLTSTSTLASNSSIGPTISVSTTSDATDNTASVNNASVLDRIGNFLKNIF